MPVGVTALPRREIRNRPAAGAWEEEGGTGEGTEGSPLVKGEFSDMAGDLVHF